MTALAQSLGNTGTIQGAVSDPSGAMVPGAKVTVRNLINGYSQTVSTGSDGSFRLLNLPPNPYHLEVAASGFASYSQDVEIRNSLPIQLTIGLRLAGAETSIEVEAAGADLLETIPSAHVDVDRSQLLKLPAIDPGSGLSQAITYSTGGVAADANGFFHPVGDHAQVSFVVDGQPISDQQSKVFSTQLPTSAIQGMELTTGTPNAEFGDKTSLVAQVTTRSAMGTNRVFGDVGASYGSFGTSSGSFSIGYGTTKFGNFLAADGTRSGRFLDSPEFQALHDIGNNQTLFDRLDFQPTGKDTLHLNLFAARNWIQIPNSYDQLLQDQRQRVLTWNIAPGYQHVFGASALLTINPYIRKDQFNYYPSRDAFADTPATQVQNRQLLNWGVRSDVALNVGRHNLKFGVDLKQTRLLENFGFGITDPAYNSPCLGESDSPVNDTSLSGLGQCAAAGYVPNPDFLPGLAPYDLSRAGGMFGFHATGNVNQYAFYGQDSISFGNLDFNLGLRVDRYDGLVQKTNPQPRLGLAYHVKKTGTVLRAAYARTMETPFNENLLLASSSGLAATVGGEAVPVAPGFRNQFNAGLQQAVGKYVLVDADYFWKFTHNSYDFFTLLNTTITFPVAWHNSKIDGVTGRVSTINIRGFQAYWTFGHTRARYFPPGEGGLLPLGGISGGVFRIDHDQAFQSTLNLRYQRPRNAEWVALTLRYDSGLVVSGVPDADVALTLTPNQQVTIGLACDGQFATLTNPLTSCGGTVTSKLIDLPQSGQGNDDHNPARVKPRNVLNLGIGTDNLLHKEGPRRITASVDLANLTGVVGLYNFLSTFSGTHFLQPRAVVGKVGFTF